MILEEEIAKASAIMGRYRVSREDQKTVVKILLDAGIDHCLNEQERLRAEKDAMIEHAQRNPLRLVN